MKLHNKIRIDQIVFIPLTGVASFCSFLKRKIFGTTRPKTIERIAVVKLTGMGSVIQATPLLQTLRANFPDAELIFITSKANKELIGVLPMVSETWIIDDSTFSSLVSSVTKLLAKFFYRRIDLYFDLEVYSYFSTVLTFLSRAKRKFGLHRIEGHFRSGVYHHVIYYNNRIPVAQVYLQLSRMIPVSHISDVFYNFSPIIKSNGNGAPEFPFRISSDFIVVNPNASELRVERRWGTQNFSSLINLLAGQFPSTQFVITGAANETKYVNEVMEGVQSEFHRRVIDSSGTLSLRQLIELISSARMMITNDSGPMHLAFALETPVIALFGPCSPEQYQISEKAVVIYQNVYCSPCVHLFLTPPCRGDNQCMKKISVERVVKAAQHVLSGSNQLPVLPVNGHPDYISSEGKPLGVMHRE